MFTNLRILLLFLAFTALPGCTDLPVKTNTPLYWQSPLLQEHPLTGHIVATATGHLLSQAQLLQAVREFDYVLIGEKHDNPDHHRLESLLLGELLAEERSEWRYPQVVFEMLDDSQHDALQALTHETTPMQRQAQLRWSEQRWPWSDYAALFDQVLEHGRILRDGNVHKETLKKVYREGRAALQPPGRFVSMDAINSQQKAVLLDHLYERHCKMMPRQQLGSMVTVQLAKDASMANAMVEQSRAILVAGAYHTRKDVGVPQHLMTLMDEGRTLVVIAILEVEAGKLQVTDYDAATLVQADYVWFTPKWTDRDYCEDMKASMLRKR